MLDLARLRALMYPHGGRMDSVPGGVPEFTIEDANHAWGILQMRDRAAAAIVDSLYAEPLVLTPEAHALLRRAQLRECWRRARSIEVAKLAVHLAEEEVDGTHGGIRGVRQALSNARAELEMARARKWPAYSPRYRAIRTMAAIELMKAAPCRGCAGRGHVRAGELVTVCKGCNGHGREPASERNRAKDIGMSRANYQREWAGVYEWTLEELSKKRTEARKIMRGILAP